MAKSVLVTSVDRSTEYPITKTISAPKCKGAVMVIFDDSYTEQMFYELPSITIEVLVDCDGEKAVYKSRGIGLQPTIGKKSFAVEISGIPTDCYFNIIPNFDNSALKAHNEAVVTGREIPYPFPDEKTISELWTTQTETFPIQLAWEDFA